MNNGRKAAEAAARPTSDPVSLEEAMRHLQDRALRVMVRKYEQRGADNIHKQGIGGVVSRIIDDKGARLQRWAQREIARDILTREGVEQEIIRSILPEAEDLAGDTVDDDLLDIANYAMICQLLIRGWWGLPLDKDTRSTT